MKEALLQDNVTSALLLGLVGELAVLQLLLVPLKPHFYSMMHMFIFCIFLQSQVF